MAGESSKDQASGEILDAPPTVKDTVKKKQRGILSRIWNVLLRRHSDDFEKRLQHISKEEASVITRMKSRSQNRRTVIRHLITYCVFFEVIAVGYAIVTTRSVELNWKMRAFRVMPMFLLPGLCSIIYSALISFTRMCDQKDQKTLKRLQAERKAKIDELKERTNYYTTQQLIQRYDSDPAVKAAAATVLASKLSADSGLKMYLGDNEPTSAAASGKTNDVEFVQSGGLRNRKQMHMGAENTTMSYHPEEDMPHRNSGNDQMDVELRPYHDGGGGGGGGGWIARIAALLVGEDPTQSYALICASCHMHNGLARKEDFSYITYYCRHCNALNRSKQVEECVSDPPPDSDSSHNMSSLTTLADDDVDDDDDNNNNNVVVNASNRKNDKMLATETTQVK